MCEKQHYMKETMQNAALRRASTHRRAKKRGLFIELKVAFC